MFPITIVKYSVKYSLLWADEIKARD